MTRRWDVSTMREYTTRDGTKKVAWTRLGVGFDSKTGEGINVNLDGYPTNGKLYLSPAKDKTTDHNGRTSYPDGNAPEGGEYPEDLTGGAPF